MASRTRSNATDSVDRLRVGGGRRAPKYRVVLITPATKRSLQSYGAGAQLRWGPLDHPLERRYADLQVAEARVREFGGEVERV